MSGGGSASPMKTQLVSAIQLQERQAEEREEEEERETAAAAKPVPKPVRKPVEEASGNCF